MRANPEGQNALVSLVLCIDILCCWLPGYCISYRYRGVNAPILFSFKRKRFSTELVVLWLSSAAYRDKLTLRVTRTFFVQRVACCNENAARHFKV